MGAKSVALYLRLSQEDEAARGKLKDESNSIHSQRLLLRQYVKEQEDLADLPLEEFVDDGYTGTNCEGTFLPYFMADANIPSERYGIFLGARALLEIPFLLLIILQAAHFFKLVRQYKAEQKAEIAAQRAEVEAHRQEAQRMKEELERLRAQMAGSIPAEKDTPRNISEDGFGGDGNGPSL